MARVERELVEYQVDGSQVLVGVFDDATSAARARDSLQQAGISADDINLLAKPGASPAAEQVVAGHAADEAPAGGVNLGTGIGVIAGAVTGATALLSIEYFPGLISALAGQNTALIIIGAIVGAVLGGWGGTLIGRDVPDEDVSYLTGDLDRGKHLVAVRTNRIDDALDVLAAAGARNLDQITEH